MSKRVLITGAASGFGKGTALELARRGHHVIAGVHVAPQKTALKREAKDEGVDLDIIVLDITNENDRQAAFEHEIDVLVNNAGIIEAGPVADMPMRIVRNNFETNVFGTLAMCQGFLPQMVERGSGKIVNVTSMGGLITIPFVAVYTATKHALEGLTEGLKAELAGTGVEICTANPGAFRTGFNDRGAETMQSWFDPEKSLSPPELLEPFAAMADLDEIPDQLDPQIMVDAIVQIVEEDNSLFRNVIPEPVADWVRASQAQAWTARKDDPLLAPQG